MDQHNNNSSNNTYIVDEQQQQQQQYSDQDESEEMMMNQEDLRRGPWTVEEDFTLINYIALNGEGRWNSLARCAGLKRTGKSCRLRWLNYLRPDVRRGNITLEEQLLILELHTRFGNRWSKIAQHLPGRTDNEIKNYWRTRVQKHAKQLKCDVNSKQFKDTMRYLWMPRLVERIQAAAANTTAAMATGRPSSSSSTTTSTTTTTTTTNTYPLNYNNNMDNNICSSQVVLPHANYNIGGSGSGSYQNVQNTPTYTPEENSSTTAAVSPAVSDLTDCYNYSVNQNHNQDYFQANNTQLGYNDSLISPCGYFNQGLNFQTMEQNNPPWAADSGGDDISDNLWNVEDIWLLQQQFNNNNM